MAPWAGYRRVSRVGDRAERLISPDVQADRIRAYAGLHGLEVEMLDAELDVSGGKAERPILGEVIAGIRDGRFAGIIVAQLDRLSRMDLADALKTIRLIEDAGGQVIAVAENFDATTPEGRMARNVILSMADMQLGRYRLQFQQSKRQAVERGIWPMSVVPIGYRLAERRLEPDPAAAPKVRRAFELRAQGTAWSLVAEHLGMGTTSARKVIANRVYLGEVRLRVDGQPVVNPAAHEPLVDRPLFEAAQLRHPKPTRTKREPPLLGGLIRCAGCRGKMTRNFEEAFAYYRCSKPQKARGRCPAPAWIGADIAERHVEALVLAHLDGVAEAQASDAVLAQAEQSVDAAEAELEAFQESVGVAGVGIEHFAAGMRKRVAAVEDARRALARERLRGAPVPGAQALRELWHELTVRERGHVLRGSLAAVWVRKGRGVGRIRVIAAGHEVVLPTPGEPICPLEWPETDLPGEIRAPRAQHVE